MECLAHGMTGHPVLRNAEVEIRREQGDATAQHHNSEVLIVMVSWLNANGATWTYAQANAQQLNVLLTKFQLAPQDVPDFASCSMTNDG